MILRTLLLFLSIFLLISPLDASKPRKRLKSRHPVYFPIVPFDENFGSKFSESRNTAQSVPPLSPPKPTTTTEKLPLAQESHVVNNAVTEAPGPSYLTDSLYYSADPTPNPIKNLNSNDELNHVEIPVFYAVSSGEDREGELGVFLQSVSSYQPSFGNKRTFDSLLNPAAMHYISPYSGESTEEISVTEEPLSLPPVRDYQQPASQSYRPPPSISSSVDRSRLSKIERKPYFAPPQNYRPPPPPPPTQASLYIRTTPPPPTTRYERPTPASLQTQATEAPVVRYRPPTTRPPRVSQSRPSVTKRIRPIRPSSSSREKVNSYFSRPVVSSNSQKTSYTPIRTSISSSSSSGFLPKPAPNPFASRISRPVVKPVNDPSKVHISQFPLKKTSTAFSNNNYRAPEPSIVKVPAVQSIYNAPSSTRKTKPKPKTSNSRRRGYGRTRKPKQKTVEIYRPKTSPITGFGSKKKDYGFDYNKASESAQKTEYRHPLVTSSPVEEAPVYRTSTKAFRAPSSLFNVRGPDKKPVTVPAQPEFIKTDSNIYVPHEYDEEAIPGIGGLDYPNYGTIPDTSFQCSSQDHPGLYADKDTNCQVFHICQEGGREDSFLCPNGTVFNQQYFVCDWWYNFSCDSADRFYSLNALIYELPEAAKNHQYS